MQNKGNAMIRGVLRCCFCPRPLPSPTISACSRGEFTSPFAVELATYAGQEGTISAELTTTKIYDTLLTIDSDGIGLASTATRRRTPSITLHLRVADEHHGRSREPRRGLLRRTAASISLLSPWRTGRLVDPKRSTRHRSRLLKEPFAPILSILATNWHSIVAPGNT